MSDKEDCWWLEMVLDYKMRYRCGGKKAEEKKAAIKAKDDKLFCRGIKK